MKMNCAMYLVSQKRVPLVSVHVPKGMMALIVNIVLLVGLHGVVKVEK